MLLPRRAVIGMDQKRTLYLDRPLLPLAVALPRILEQIEAELADVKLSAVEKWRSPRAGQTGGRSAGSAPIQRNASNRLSTPLGRSTCQAGTGPAMPSTLTASRARYSNRSPTSRRVLAAITTVSGSAKACKPAARLGVSPT